AQHAAELPHDGQLLLAHECLFAAGAGGVDIHGREDPLVREVTGQAQLHVAGALELLEDHLVHLRAGLHQRGGEDRQRAAVLDVARRTEEALRRVERGGVHTTGEDPAGGGGGEVVGTAQAGDRVQQHDHVAAHLHQALRTLDRELGDDGVVRGGTDEGRGDDLALDRALHVRDLLWALDEEHVHGVDLGVVDGDRVRDLLHDVRLAGLRGRDDEAALSLADRRDEVDDAWRERGLRALHAQALIRVQRGQLREVHALAGALRRHAVDGVDLHEGRVPRVVAAALAAAVAAAVVLLLDLGLLAIARGLDLADDRIALAQARLLDLVHGHVDIAGAGQVAGGAHVGVVVADIEDARDGHQLVALAHLVVVVLRATLLLRRARVATAATLAVTGAVAAARAAPTVIVVVAALTVIVTATGAVRQLDVLEPAALPATVLVTAVLVAAVLIATVLLATLLVTAVMLVGLAVLLLGARAALAI